MSPRRRYVYDEDLKQMVEISPEWEPTVRTEISMDRFYENTAATDGTDIGSRKKRREYMKRYALADYDDFKDTWAKAAKEREAFYTGTNRDPERREAIGRAWYELERKGRRK